VSPLTPLPLPTGEREGGEGLWRQLWHIRKPEEVLGTEGIVRDSAWVSNDLAANVSRQEASWFVRKGLESFQERMWVWVRIIPSLQELKGSSNMRKEEEIKSR
jgi:hypothetical protein